MDQGVRRALAGKGSILNVHFNTDRASVQGEELAFPARRIEKPLGGLGTDPIHQHSRHFRRGEELSELFLALSQLRAPFLSLPIVQMTYARKFPFSG